MKNFDYHKPLALSVSCHLDRRTQKVRRNHLAGALRVLGGAIVLSASLHALGLQVAFVGTDRTHLAYAHTVSGDGAVELLVEEPGGGERRIAYAEGVGVHIGGPTLDSGLAAGTCRYIIRQCWRDPVTKELGAWSLVTEALIRVDSAAANGSLLFDEEIAAPESGLMLNGVTVPAGRSLTLAGTFIAPTNEIAALSVYGTLALNGGLTLLPRVREPVSADIPFRVELHEAQSLSGITGGLFVLNAAGASFLSCAGTQFLPRKGGTLHSITNGVVELSGLEQGKTLTVTESWLASGTSYTDGTFYGYGYQCIAGEVVLQRVVWSGRFEALSNASVSAAESEFLDPVVVGDHYALGDPAFFAEDCRFNTLHVSCVAAGRVRLDSCLFAGAVGAYGGAALFEGCEFAVGFRLQDRSATVLTGCRFLAALVFGNSDYPLDATVPRWYEAAAPSPQISGNAFMGDSALRYETLPGAGGLPSSPIAIAANYYGSAAGTFNDVSGAERGFLPSAYGARVHGNAGALAAFAIAAPLADSPLSGTRQDTRVFPEFWINGHIIGQNTIDHQGSTIDTTGGRALLKGRETLLALDLSCTEESLAGVRVYAEWDGQEIDALPEVKSVRRDPAQFAANMVRGARTTHSIILPAVQSSSLPLVVRLDVSKVAGFDSAAYPQENEVLLSGTVAFTDPPARPLRIWVYPVEVTGVFGTWGTGSATATVEALKSGIPDMLPLPDDKLQVVQKPVLSVWSPTSFVTSIGLLNKVSASLAFGRWIVSGLDAAPDFVVAVMPHGLITGGAEGASFMGRRRVLFVDELYADAVLHELGHGIGLFTQTEQYDAFPAVGLPVERATLFRNATQGGVQRIRHQAGPDHAWYDENAVYYDIMGAASFSAPMDFTLESFHNWFQANLALPEPTGTALMQGPLPAAMPAPLGAPAVGYRRILVSGATDYHYNLRTGSVNLFDVTLLGYDPQPPVTGTYYYLRAYDAADVLIHETGFLPQRETAEWIATFDIPAESASCRIVKSSDSSIAAQVETTDLTATVLDAPAAGATIGCQFDMNWHSTSRVAPASGQLRHLLFYRTAPAAEWTLLTGPVAATNLTLTTAEFPETESLELRLVTSDGLSSSEQIVAGITVPPRLPLITIRSPESGAQAQSNAVWQLAAEVTDFPDGSAGPGVWHSSLQGRLGEGRRLAIELAPGDHRLRYESATASGLTNSAEVAVQVSTALTSNSLGFVKSDLTLHNRVQDPTGLVPAYIVRNATNQFSLLVRNGGADATARLRLYLQTPVAGETLAATYDVALAPFGTQSFTLAFFANADGEYAIRAVLDNLSPHDPDLTDNERIWSFSSVTPVITLTGNPPAGGMLFGAETYIYGAAVTVGVTPNPGYLFVNWTENNSEVSTDLEFSFEATANRTLRANFTTPTVIALQAAPAAAGTVSGGGSYPPGAAVTVLANPGPGYQFVSWTEYGYEVSANAEYTFTATGNRTLTANFMAEAVPTISIWGWPWEGGTVSGGGPYAVGTSVSVTAIPNAGYMFVNWTEWNNDMVAFAEVSASATYAFVVAGDRSLRANFALLPLTGEMPIADALDAPQLTFTTGQSSAWVGLKLVTAVRGGDAARSGYTADGATSWMQCSVTGPGTLTFWWRASSEQGFDQAFFLVNGQEGDVIDGETAWLAVTNTLDAGTHTLRWEYRKDSMFADGDDCVWVDNVEFASAGGSAQTATTPVAVPHAWLDGYPDLLAAFGGDYEAAAWSDTDGDGHTAWQEYVGGSDPHDPASVLRLLLTFENGLPQVRWQPDLGPERSYTLYGKAALSEVLWSTPTNSATRFFRLGVQIP